MGQRSKTTGGSMKLRLVLIAGLVFGFQTANAQQSNGDLLKEFRAESVVHTDKAKAAYERSLDLQIKATTAAIEKDTAAFTQYERAASLANQESQQEGKAAQDAEEAADLLTPGYCDNTCDPQCGNNSDGMAPTQSDLAERAKRLEGK
jgi:hypothetical protein